MTDSVLKKLSQSINLVGGQEKLAQDLGLKTQGQISSWVTGRRPLPSKHCIKIEQLTNSQITRYELRPDVFGKSPVNIKAA